MDTPWGNYLNLPYFGGGNPQGQRMVLDLGTHEPIPLLSWLGNISTFTAAELSLLCSSLSSNNPVHSDTVERKIGLQDLLSTAHTTGSRRPTLVSVVGHLRSRGVTEDVAVLLVVPWAKAHFRPELPEAEVEKHIRGIYRRYGVAGVTTRRLNSHAILPTIEV